MDLRREALPGFYSEIILFSDRNIEGTSKNSSHEESTESFPFARVAGSSPKKTSQRMNSARGFLLRAARRIFRGALESP